MGKRLERIHDSSEEELAVRTVESFYRVLGELLAEEESVVVSLPGGRSVQPLYLKIPDHAERLSQKEWKRVHFFWTDERLVPPDSPESNYGLAQELFLRDLQNRDLIDGDNVHRFPGEAEKIPGALEDYDNELREISGGRIHLPLLGVGGDGHVGSLFPGSNQLESKSDGFLLVSDSPKPPERRITLSPELIRGSTHPFLFFIGEEKRAAYRCFRDDEKQPGDCPCKLALEGEPGVVHAVTDLEIGAS